MGVQLHASLSAPQRLPFLSTSGALRTVHKTGLVPVVGKRDVPASVTLEADGGGDVRLHVSPNLSNFWHLVHLTQNGDVLPQGLGPHSLQASSFEGCTHLPRQN